MGWGCKRPITGTGRETHGDSLALVVLVYYDEGFRSDRLGHVRRTT